MKIVLLQTDIAWANLEANVKNADAEIDKYEGVDLYVLPEMFSTGFCTEPQGIAESADSKTLRWMKSKAKEKDCALAGSVAIEENGKYCNRFYFVHPDGKVEWYDKKHLFTYGGEHKRYTAGKEKLIVSFKGWRIRLFVCYDLRFPVWSRNHNEYDVAIYVASWPTPRVDAWKTLLRARAIENQCYVLGVNRVGNDPYCNYTGGTAAIDPYGNTLAACTDGMAMSVETEIDMDGLNSFREKFPVLNDADEFELK